MNIRQEWMTDNQYFGLDYPNNKLLDEAIERFNIQKNSLEGKDALIDGVEERVVAQIHLNNVKSNQDELKLFTDTSSLVHTGSIVKIENITYLVTDDVKNNGAYKSTAILPSVFSITVYKNGNPIQIPIVVEGRIRLYSMGQDSTKYINILSDEIIVYIPNNMDTETIAVDDVYKIGRRNYKIMTVQDIIKNGLLVIKMEVTLEEPIIPVNNYILTITNGDSISLTTSETLQLSVTLTNNGVPVENPTVIYSSSNEEICTVSTTGLIQPISEGVVTITAVSNGVSDTIEVTVEEVVADNYSIVILGSNSIYQNQSKTYSCIVYNNGVEEVKNCVWSISDTTLTTITTQNSTSCTIKANSSLLGTVNLRCEMVENNTVFSIISIQVKSII